MASLLYIEASPRKARSSSIAVARVFLDELGKRHAGLIVDRLDLWNEPLPDFDGAMIAAKYAKLAGQEFEPAEAAAWATIAALVQRIASADAVLIATPMWNFGIPYKLKHWIDLITQPGLAFSFTPGVGYSPILKPRPTLVILSSAGDYAAGPSYGRPDLATPYLETALAFIGLTGIAVEKIGPTIGPEAETRAAKARANDRLAARAATFLENVP